MQKKALKTGLVKESGQQEVDEDYINEEVRQNIFKCTFSFVVANNISALDFTK